MRNRLVNLALVVVILIALLPAAALYFASWFAAKHGCSVSAGFSQTCVVDGRDWTPTLSSAFDAGQLMLIGLPVAILALFYLSRRIVKARRAG